MVCPFRVAVKREDRNDGIATYPTYMPCYECECPLYYVKGLSGGTGCKRVDKELEREE